MRALVIGATGFIGIHVVDALLSEGFSVRATRRRSSPTMLLRKRTVELVSASIDDVESLKRALDGVDVLVHAAGHYPRYSNDAESSIVQGVQGIRNLCEAALNSNVRRIVYTSSVSALGGEPGSVVDESCTIPPRLLEGVYPSTKKAMEQEIERGRDRGLPIVSLFVGGALGPLDLRLGTNGLLASLLSARIPFFVDGFTQVVSVQDVATAHVRAISAPQSRYCVGGHNVRLGSFLRSTARRFSVPFTAPQVSLAAAEALSDAAEIAALATRARVPFPREFVDIVGLNLKVTSELAERELGVSLTPLERVVDSSYEWIKRLGVLSRLAKERNTEHGHPLC